MIVPYTPAGCTDQIARALRLDETHARLDAMGAFPAGGAPEEFARFIDTKTGTWGRVIRQAKVRPD